MDKQWRAVVGYEGFYEVSENGEVRSVSRIVSIGSTTRKIEGKTLSMSKDQDGYLTVSLSKKNKVVTKRVHRLVAEAFIPNPDNLPIINHKDEIKDNNNYKNLEWCTIKYNTRYGKCIEKRSSKLKKPIMAIKEDETYIFPSIIETSKVLNISHGNISGCLNNYYGRKTCKGYRFEFIRG